MRFLQSPKEFHSTLIELISKAEERIDLCSLYFGCNHHVSDSHSSSHENEGKQAERQLWLTLYERMLDKPNLQVHLLMDELRSNRQYKTDTHRFNRISSTNEQASSNNKIDSSPCFRSIEDAFVKATSSLNFFHLILLSTLKMLVLTVSTLMMAMWIRMLKC